VISTTSPASERNGIFASSSGEKKEKVVKSPSMKGREGGGATMHSWLNRSSSALSIEKKKKKRKEELIMNCSLRPRGKKKKRGSESRLYIRVLG